MAIEDTSGSLGPPAMASPAGDNSHLFAGVHFLLIGFDSVTKSQYRSKLVQSGGTDAMLFGGGCTHVVARGRVYDDPVCALARAQGSKVVSQIWLDDSLDRGVLADADRVIYWPARDLKGIPGSGSLQICLTGYQKKDREDIMKMVSLMGAQFSKRLLAPSVTHEGEKYKLAESLGIKIVNHRWLEDCLKSWEVLPVEDYSESGWILEIMEAQAKERLKFPIRDRLRAARRKRAVRKAKSSSKVRSSPGAPKPRPSRGGHRFLGVRRSSSRHPGPDRQIRRGRRSLCCLLLWQAQRRQAPAVVGVGAAPDEAAMI